MPYIHCRSETYIQRRSAMYILRSAMARSLKTTNIILRVTEEEKAQIEKAALSYTRRIGTTRLEKYGERWGSISAYMLDLHRKSVIAHPVPEGDF